MDPSTQHDTIYKDKKNVKERNAVCDGIEGVIVKQFNKWMNKTHARLLRDTNPQ